MATVIGFKWDDWHKRITCDSPSCEAILEITEEDVLAPDGDSRYLYGVKCPACGHLIHLGMLEIPPRIKKELDSRRIYHAR